MLKLLAYGTLFSQLNITGKCIALLRRFSVIFDIVIKFPYIELLAISVVDSYRGYHICLRMFFFGDGGGFTARKLCLSGDTFMFLASM